MLSLVDLELGRALIGSLPRSQDAAQEQTTVNASVDPENDLLFQPRNTGTWQPELAFPNARLLSAHFSQAGANGPRLERAVAPPHPGTY